ncbi:hypothetical protein V8E55_008163 [Tylopilus felleus]
MQLRLDLNFSNVFGAALIVLLTCTSLAQSAAIRRDISPATRDQGEQTHLSGAEVANDSILRDAIKFVIQPRRETIAARDSDGTDGFVDDWYTLAARDTEHNE